MVQIKVTPEMLEEVANRASNTRHALESIHNNLCNQIDHLCSQWIGASNQHFVQMFNDAKPKAFTSINSIVQVEEDLKRIAEKFRNTDNQDVTLEEDTAISKPSSEEGFDGGKLARDIAGELTGEYDAKRVMEGVDPETGEKLSRWERGLAGVMLVAGLTPVGKGIKVVKGAKKVADGIDAAAKLEKQRKTLKANQITGKEYETKMFESIKQQKPKSEITEQITVETKSGVRTRIDIGGKDPNGKIDLVELKSSMTAPLTKNQKKAFPEIEESGAIVKSRNKPPFEHLEEIPPTKINVIRKEK
ncbi:TPA: WXG100 family type VII secretion target [Bacillus cereus]|uniref:WXG100 family type VII secretion target n=1 Tax=Bacillus cereus group TaxID=86661 RepID=UPI0000E89FA1|nr:MULTISPECIES: WXG100 family type VII secretion target [Bacillus cereus group]ABK88200.1 truncated conserved hypothetical protein [Bacillus thuringiensis str. Al Hakam]AJH66303.1 type VII secretion target family protein [Bacillus thuringiensis]MCC2347156.1 WXG100 family type VII secretion target [Bacillus anthracis]MCU5601020.1 WXG100 family type VII secretion target [Bacillus wiedmannii]MCX3313539.1 WXG100 family type VII secretion target [Bacillus wiedmannii]